MIETDGVGRKRAVVYCRVTPDTKPGREALDRQEADCKAKAQELGIDVTRVESEVASGTDLRREGLGRAISAIEAGDAEVVLCHTLDRLARDAWHLYLIERVIRGAGGELMLVEGDAADFGTTGWVKFVDSIHTAFGDDTPPRPRGLTTEKEGGNGER